MQGEKTAGYSGYLGRNTCIYYDVIAIVHTTLLILKKKPSKSGVELDVRVF